jgi:hypothetical protein
MKWKCDINKPLKHLRAVWEFCVCDIAYSEWWDDADLGTSAKVDKS